MAENTNLNGNDYRVFEREVLDRLIKIEVKLDGLNDLDNLAHKNQQEIIKMRKDTDEQEKRILAIESSNTWLWRSVAGAAITGVVSLLVAMLQHGFIR